MFFFQKGRDRPSHVSKLSAGHLWGEKALFIGEASLFSITVESQEATLLLVTRESLRSLYGEHKQLHLEMCRCNV